MTVKERREFGQLFRAERMARGLTQLEVALALKLDQSRVSKIENMGLVPKAYPGKHAAILEALCQLDPRTEPGKIIPPPRGELTKMLHADPSKGPMIEVLCFVLRQLGLEVYEVEAIGEPVTVL